MVVFRPETLLVLNGDHANEGLGGPGDIDLFALATRPDACLEVLLGTVDLSLGFSMLTRTVALGLVVLAVCVLVVLAVRVRVGGTARI